MNCLRRWFHEWAKGDNPMDEEMVYSTIYEHYHVSMYITGIFLDMRPTHWIVSVVGLLYSLGTLSQYAWMYIVTVFHQKDDFPSAAVSAGVVVMGIFGIYFTIHINCNRNNLIELFRVMSYEFVKHNDSEIDEATIEEIAKIKKRGKYVLILVPTCLLLGGTIVLLLGPVADSVAGVSSDSAYEKDVYMRLPLPIWQPFKVTSDFLHYIALLGFAIALGYLVSAYIGMVIYLVVSLQSIAIQLTILKMRIRNISQKAYELHVDLGGPKLRKKAMFADHSYQKCYNECLNRCVAHHISIMKGFKRFNDSIGFLIDIVVVFVAILVAMALLALVVGGKPSSLIVGLVSLYIETINTTIIFWACDNVTDLAESLRSDLYDTHWQEIDKKANRTLLIFQERLKVMNSAYTYLNLIIAMRE